MMALDQLVETSQLVLFEQPQAHAAKQPLLLFGWEYPVGMVGHRRSKAGAAGFGQQKGTTDCPAAP